MKFRQVLWYIFFIPFLFLFFGLPLIYEEPVVRLRGVTDCDSITITANPEYSGSSFKRFLLGNLYRDVWTIPVKVPCLDLNSEAGGLTPVKKGGGQQTLSLQMKGKNGYIYNIRSVDKNPISVIPVTYRQTIFRSLIQDMIASENPYGALVVASLAEAIGIPHTQPRVVFVPDDPVLGIFQSEFGGLLALFEIRPDNDLKDFEPFGNPAHIINTHRFYEWMKADARHQPDVRQYFRARLLDMLVNDWDRHEDQWRWAVFNHKQLSETAETKKVAVADSAIAIPRDRDQAFMRFEGMLPGFVHQKWGLRKIRSFTPEYHDIIGLNLNAQYLDALLLSRLDQKEWENEIVNVQSALSDPVIHAAFLKFPPEVYRVVGAGMEKTLRSRRNNLKESLIEYFRELNKIADVPGTDSDEGFEIEFMDDGFISITITQSDSVLAPIITFQRTYDPSYTKEIFIHPMGGKNLIYLYGNPDSKIKITLMDAEGENIFIDQQNLKPGIIISQKPSNVYNRFVHEE